jgi:hypothetical protein
VIENETLGISISLSQMFRVAFVGVGCLGVCLLVLAQIQPRPDAVSKAPKGAPSVITDDLGKRPAGAGRGVTEGRSDRQAGNPIPVWLLPLMSFAGVVVGSTLSLFGLWLKERRELRASVQRWYEDEFIFGGVEEVLHWLDYLRAVLDQRMDLTKLAELRPDSASRGRARVSAVLDSDVVWELSNVIDSGFRRLSSSYSEAGRNELVDFVKRQISHFRSLERALMRMAVKRKPDVFDIHLDPEVERIRARLAEESKLILGNSSARL